MMMPSSTPGPADDRPRLTRLATSTGLLAGTALSVAVALWQLALGPRFPHVALENRLDAGTRVGALRAIAFAELATFAIAGAVAWGLRRHRPVLRSLERVARRTAPLLISAVVPPLFSWWLWRLNREIIFLLLATAAVLGTQRLLYFALTGPPVFPVSAWPARAMAIARRGVGDFAAASGRHGPLLLVCGAVAGYALFFSYHTIVHHRNILSSAFDLGIEDNLIWNLLHANGPLFKSSPFAGPTGTHLGNHATWFAFLIAPIYALRPNAETLLAFQSTLMGAAAVPLYLVARRHLSAGLSGLIAILYLFYPPLHGPNLFDFHYPGMAPFFLWFTLFFLEGRRDVWAAVFAVIALSIREDVSAGLVVIGGYLVLTDRRPRAGLVLAAVGALYFLSMKMLVMPLFAGGQQAFVDEMYGGLLPAGEHSYGGVLKTVFSNPAFVLDAALVQTEKLAYLLALLVPLAFLPLRRPIGLLCCVPGFFFTLLSTDYRPLYHISFQYTTHWTAYLFIALVATLAWMRRATAAGEPEARARQMAWLGALILGMASTSHQMGALLQQNTVRGGFRTFHFGTTADDLLRHDSVRGLVALVPPLAKIAASEYVVPQVSSRPDAYTLRIGIFDAEYILFGLPLLPKERARLVDVLPRGLFGVLARASNYVLLKRGHSTADNPPLLGELGM